jgi:putative ABC transport system permease protein
MFQNYFKIALRNLARHKGYSAINIIGLSVGISVCFVIMLFIADELSYDKYHKKAERIFRVVSHGKWGEEKFDITGTSGLAAAAFKKDFPEVEDAVRINAEGGGIFKYGDKTIKEDGALLTDPSFFSVFTYQFIAGTESALKQPNSIVLTKTIAAKLFTNPLTALNKVIYIDDAPTTVTGVIEDVPTNSHFTFKALRSFPENYQSDWSNLSIYTYILLKPNAEIGRLRAKIPAFVTKYLKQDNNDVNYKLGLQPITSIHLHSHLSYELGENHDIKYVYVLSVVGLLIIIIALINYINITTARATVRLKEVAVRKITGSSRNSLFSLFLTESLITVLSAAVISVFLVGLAMPVFNYLMGKELSIWQFGTGKTIICLLTFSFLAGLVGGLYPAFFLSRFKPIPALKNQLGDVKGQAIFRKSLVMFQFAVTVIMITASFIIYLQLKYVSNKDLGFNKNQLLTFHIDSRSVREKVPAIRTALLQNPLVKAVASAGNPIGNNDIGMMDYNVEKNGVLDEHPNLAYGLTVDADFIPAMQIKLLGRAQLLHTNIL